MSTRKKLWLVLICLPFIVWILRLLVSGIFYFIAAILSPDWVSNLPNDQSMILIEQIKKIINRVLGMLWLIGIIWFIPWIIMLAIKDKTNLTQDMEEIKLDDKYTYWWLWIRLLAKSVDASLSFLFVPIIFNLIYYFREWQTIGYKLLWLRIVDKSTKNTPDASNLVGRYFAKILSAMPLELWFLWIWRDKKKQWFHDILAWTIVIQKKVDVWRIILWVIALLLYIIYMVLYISSALNQVSWKL